MHFAYSDKTVVIEQKQPYFFPSTDPAAVVAFSCLTFYGFDVALMPALSDFVDHLKNLYEWSTNDWCNELFFISSAKHDKVGWEKKYKSFYTMGIEGMQKRNLMGTPNPR